MHISELVTMAILAGGKSRRMGQDKSFIMLDGRMMIEHILDRIQPLGQPIIIIANHPAAYARFGLPIYPDILPDAAAMGGIHAAISHSQTEHTFCVACDMPGLSTLLMQGMIDQPMDYDALVPRVGDVAQGLHAIYNRRCLSSLTTLIEQRQLRVSNLFNRVNTRYLDQDWLQPYMMDGDVFMNVNTPADLNALRHLREHGSSQA